MSHSLWIVLSNPWWLAIVPWISCLGPHYIANQNQPPQIKRSANHHFPSFKKIQNWVKNLNKYWITRDWKQVGDDSVRVPSGSVKVDVWFSQRVYGLLPETTRDAHHHFYGSNFVHGKTNHEFGTWTVNYDWNCWILFHGTSRAFHQKPMGLQDKLSIYSDNKLPW